MKDSCIDEIRREYEKDRLEADKLKIKLRDEVYGKIPRVSEIDDKLRQMALSLSRDILEGKESSIQDLKAESEKLRIEKISVLEESGYKADYMDKVYKCQKCQDTGYAGNERCTCFNQKLINKYYNMSNLGDILLRENFDTFDFRFYSHEKIGSEGISPQDKIKIIYSTAIKFSQNFQSAHDNLLFYGKPGLGKTFMCNSIAKDVLDKGFTVLYQTSGKLFKVIEDVRFNKARDVNADGLIDFFYSADLLIIDDLGTEFSTLATQSALFEIINSRILDKKSTIISSNLSPKELEAMYSDRLVSRLQNYTFCKFLGEDIRQIKKYSFRGK